MLLLGAKTRNAKAKLAAKRTLAAASSVERNKVQFMSSMNSDAAVLCSAASLALTFLVSVSF